MLHKQSKKHFLDQLDFMADDHMSSSSCNTVALLIFRPLGSMIHGETLAIALLSPGPLFYSSRTQTKAVQY